MRVTAEEKIEDESHNPKVDGSQAVSQVCSMDSAIIPKQFEGELNADLLCRLAGRGTFVSGGHNAELDCDGEVAHFEYGHAWPTDVLLPAPGNPSSLGW